MAAQFGRTSEAEQLCVYSGATFVDPIVNLMCASVFFVFTKAVLDGLNITMY